MDKDENPPIEDPRIPTEPQSAIHKLFKTNKQMEVKGIWIDYGDFRFRIARAGGNNKRYQKRLEAVTRPFRRAIQTDTLPAERADELIMQVYAETVVLAWEGVTNDDGSPRNFTAQSCIELFKELPDLFRDLQDQAQKVALFRQEVDEVDAGN